MHLCGASLSPYYERVHLVAQLKGGTEGLKLGGMPCEMKSEAHFGFNPTGKLPFLIMDDDTDALIESQVIAEYLDETLEGLSLMPSDPRIKAQVRLICRIVDLYLAPIVERCWGNKGHSEEEKRRGVIEELPKVWDYLERYIDGDGYAVGDGWTIADCAMMPWLFHFERFVSEFGDWGVGERPKLINWLAHAGKSELATESYKRSEKSLKMLIAYQKARASDEKIGAIPTEE